MPGTYYDTTVNEYLHWPTPNYTDPEERSWMPIYAIVMLVIATFCVFGRLIARRMSSQLGWDDGFVFVAWIFSVAFTVMACLASWQLNLGRHTWDLPPLNWSPALENGWLAQIFFTNSLCATKVAILGFYMRLFRGKTNKRWLWATWGLMVMTVIIWVGFVFTYIFMCMPISDVWNWPTLQLMGQTTFKCANGNALVISVGILTIASDFWCALLPCVYFQHNDLGSTKRQKIVMNIIFCSGFAISGVGAARTYYLWELGHDTDTSWVGYNLYAASIAECQLSLLCCCVPFLRAFFRKTFPNSSQWRNSGGSSSWRSTIRWSKPPNSDTTHDPEFASEHALKHYPLEKGLSTAEATTVCVGRPYVGTY